MDAILAVLEKAGRYLLTIRITDLLDIAIMAYLVYKLLSLVKSTRAANILKGVAIFLAALWLSSALELRSVNYLLSHMVSVGDSVPAGAAADSRADRQQKYPPAQGVRTGAASFGDGAGHRPDGHGLHRNVQIPDRRADRL